MQQHALERNGVRNGATSDEQHLELREDKQEEEKQEKDKAERATQMRARFLLQQHREAAQVCVCVRVCLCLCLCLCLFCVWWRCA